MAAREGWDNIWGGWGALGKSQAGVARVHVVRCFCCINRSIVPALPRGRGVCMSRGAARSWAWQATPGCARLWRPAPCCGPGRAGARLSWPLWLGVEGGQGLGGAAAARHASLARQVHWQ